MFQVEFEAGAITIDANLIAAALNLEVGAVQPLIREGKLTSVCESGVDADAGTYRLTFFLGNRRARFIVDESGNVLQRSVIDFGDHPISGRSGKAGVQLGKDAS